MYVPFQDATSLPVSYDTLPEYAFAQHRVPAVSATAARATDGRLYVSVANLHPGAAAELELSVAGAAVGSASAQLLTADAMNSHNTFAAPGTVQPEPFDGVSGDRNTLTLTLPAKSIVMIAIATEAE
jgi:alpha-N-arabinofuranosidase